MEEGNCKGISMDVGLLFGQTLRGGEGVAKFMYAHLIEGL